MNKDYIKWGLIIVGGYVAYVWWRDGNLNNLFNFANLLGSSGASVSAAQAAADAAAKAKAAADAAAQNVVNANQTGNPDLIAKAAADKAAADAAAAAATDAANKLAAAAKSCIAAGGTWDAVAQACTQASKPTAPIVVLISPVVPDINNSLKGTVTINGTSQTLNVLLDSGSVYNTQGQDVTASLQASGVDTGALLTMFENAAAGSIPSCAELPRAIAAYSGMSDPASQAHLQALKAAQANCPPVTTQSGTVSGLGLTWRGMPVPRWRM